MGSNLDGIYLLDGHFFTLISCKKLLVCLKRPKINEKEAGVGPFLKKPASENTQLKNAVDLEPFCQLERSIAKFVLSLTLFPL